MSDALPHILTLTDVLTYLHGRIGRTKLLEHLRDTPMHAGAPTHRRWGARRIVFYPDDVKRLIESLECPSKSSHVPVAITSISAEPSGEKAFSKALKHLTQLKQKNSGRTGKRSYGKKVSMERRQS